MTNSFMDTITEPVFLAASPLELERAIELLDAHGITFTTGRASFGEPHSGEARGGIAFRVLNRQAEFCRQILGDHGLGRGVVPAGATPVVAEPALTRA